MEASQRASAPLPPYDNQKKSRVFQFETTCLVVYQAIHFLITQGRDLTMSMPSTEGVCTKPHCKNLIPLQTDPHQKTYQKCDHCHAQDATSMATRRKNEN